MKIPVFAPQDQRIVEERDICKNVYEGSSKAVKYLVKQNAESTNGFKDRRDISAIGTTFRKGVNSFVDIVMRRPISINNKVPTNIQTFYERADGRRVLNEVVKDAMKETLFSNRVYALVWTPKNTARNAKEEQELGIRPYLELITRDRIVPNVTKKDRYGNYTQIGVVGSYVLEETRYEMVRDVEYRIYFNDGVVEIWREKKEGTDSHYLHETIISDVKEMPIKELIFDAVIDSPPFINEAKRQIQHYNIESAKDSYNVKLAFPFVKTWGMLQNSRNIATNAVDENGNPIKKVEFQSNKGIDFPVNPETGAKLGDIEIMELSGDADAVLKSSMDDKVKAIAEGFVNMTLDQAGNKTVEQAENESVGGEAQSSNIAQTIEDWTNEIHDLFCKFAGVKTVGEITTNKEFVKTTLSDLVYKMLYDLFADEVLDRKAFVTELKKYDVLKTVDIEELENRMIAKGVV